MQPDSFYFNVLPFAEDVREFQFPSFANFPAAWQPNEQQLEAAANFIKTRDLAPHGKEEVLLPDLTPNPVLEVHISLYIFDIGIFLSCDCCLNCEYAFSLPCICYR